MEKNVKYYNTDRALEKGSYINNKENEQNIEKKSREHYVTAFVIHIMDVILELVNKIEEKF